MLGAGSWWRGSPIRGQELVFGGSWCCDKLSVSHVLQQPRGNTNGNGRLVVALMVWLQKYINHLHIFVKPHRLGLMRPSGTVTLCRVQSHGEARAHRNRVAPACCGTLAHRTTGSAGGDGRSFLLAGETHERIFPLDLHERVRGQRIFVVDSRSEPWIAFLSVASATESFANTSTRAYLTRAKSQGLDCPSPDLRNQL